MISIVIPTLNAESCLAATLTALVPGVVAGIVREVVIVDGGSNDRTLKIADASGATIIKPGARGRGQQLIAGAAAAKGDWLLFLHADTVLEHGWEREVATFMERIDNGQRPEAAAAFQFALDDVGTAPRLIEAGVQLRCMAMRLPFGDQGLLIPRRLYHAVGGYKPLPMMEDIDLVRRLRRSQKVLLRSRAITSAVRFRKEGYARRVSRNWACLAMYYMRIQPDRIARFYAR